VVLENAKAGLTQSFAINSYSNFSFSGVISDAEVNENTVKDTQLKISNQFIAFDGLFLYTITGGKVQKRNKNFEVLNEYTYALPGALNISNLTDIKAVNSNLYLRFSNGSVVK
jgi:hypothetical protein